MTAPDVAQKGPYVLDLQPGTYWWCACGRSKTQPFCDGSHQGTSFAPVKCEISEPGKIAFCGCKHTANQPFCDGTHNRL